MDSHIRNQLLSTGDEEDSGDSIVVRRIQRLSLHLNPNIISDHEQSTSNIMNIMDTLSCASFKSTTKRPLSDYMRGKYVVDLQERILEHFNSRPDLQTPSIGISMDDHRELCYRQLMSLIKEAGIKPLRYITEDVEKYLAILEAVGTIDMSLAIMIGKITIFLCSLWGGSVVNLGTKKHHEKYFEGIDNLEYMGCFAMTELHHGSNVQGLQTTALFDPITDEFIIDTPNDGAIKWWIGNAALHGKFASVFARLLLPTYDDDKGVSDMGVHAFIVPIRDLETHQTLPGIEIHDCGQKIGLNGIDNGALRFRSVRIPRENLLNRMGDVSRDGKYTSGIPTVSKRFAATLGELVGGRVGLTFYSVSVLKVVCTIAIRYSFFLQQFGPPKKPEMLILDYHSHRQHRLMPMLASAYAFHFAAKSLIGKYSYMKKFQDDKEIGDIHSLSSGLKAYITTYTAKALSVCRESCSGHGYGYAAVNRFGSLRNDHDVFQTFEGDNTVLLQQVAGDLLKQYQEKFQGGTISVSWNYLKESMSSYLSQPNPVTSRWESADHLRDPKFQLDAFSYRTSRLLQTAAVRLQKHSKKLGGFGAWNRCLNHLLTLSESHIETVILTKFIEAVQSCPDENSRAGLKLVCDLYALDRIWNDIGTYRNIDYVAPNKAKVKTNKKMIFQIPSFVKLIYIIYCVCCR
ncbi:acyl-coenzyme A oxidase 2, peroxisomal-like [Impatiens glandulifera]|uniref:acyl-coenzyme A oxidase 2, peroxisomal-like n=1 Tax=Impatiens glandulifera TaxID=253017 RepID=UPI001FB0F2FE|nr:acyl-coenzyme A oxidase 2, peroxisomal-like [Impatiens glandulifera]